jgi:hypothetical protein
MSKGSIGKKKKSDTWKRHKENEKEEEEEEEDIEHFIVYKMCGVEWWPSNTKADCHNIEYHCKQK